MLKRNKLKYKESRMKVFYNMMRCVGSVRIKQAHDGVKVDS